MIFTVTQEDIDSVMAKSCRTCPVALALLKFAAWTLVGEQNILLKTLILLYQRLLLSLFEILIEGVVLSLFRLSFRMRGNYDNNCYSG